IEKSQIFVSFLWMSVTWKNELISWKPEDFCGITQVSLPREMLWKPDLSIFELTEKQSGLPSHYLCITYKGEVTMEEDLRIDTTCTMDIHKFPFDTQRCEITFSSIIHSSSEIKLIAASNSSKATQNSRTYMISQGEWELLGMNVTEGNFSYFENGKWDFIKYTISIRRMPLLHIINFQLPVLFFLVLDLASFFIPDTKGEKLSFKVTVLLAISVLLLILNDILPSKSDQSPLIATYVIFIFAFMLLSLLETILVTYLTELDLGSEEQAGENIPKSSFHSLKPEELFSKQNGDIALEKHGKRKHDSDGCTFSVMSSPSESVRELSGAGATADLHQLQLILVHLQDLRQNVLLALKPQGRGRYWGRVAKRINAAFFVFYFCSILLFLILITLEWTG
ncbi:hypothetical protein NFI96_034431, partial [Prochilodus magdalenae]